MFDNLISLNILSFHSITDASIIAFFASELYAALLRMDFGTKGVTQAYLK